MVSKFVHLRVHTAYSLSESTLGISKLAELAQNDGQPAMAITDSQNLFGAYEFSKTMAQSGIQPIIGASIFLNDENGDGEVALLAQNKIGYKNLSKLMSDAWMRCDGSEKPKVKVGEFLTSSEGLILLTGGPKDGFISRVVLQTPAIALARLRMLSDNLQGRVYVELQRHGLQLEYDIEEKLLEFADQLTLPLIATNDCHFENDEMFVPQKILTCIATNQRLASMTTYNQSAHHRFKTADEMAALFVDIPEAISNSLLIAKRCAFMIQDREPILPEYRDPEGRTPEQVLRIQAEQGLIQRMESLESAGKLEFDKQDYVERLNYELSVIIEMGFTGYFLIVSDFINWANDNCNQSAAC